jgi:hypothetical protein
MQDQMEPRPTLLVWLYTIVLMGLYNLAVAGLISVPVSFIYMNDLHLTAVQQSSFGLYTDAPYFIGFVFGFLRDRWRPGGKGDRGYFFAVPILMAAVYVWMAYAPHTAGVLIFGQILIAILASVLGAAAQGLLAAIAKDFGMTGRLAVVALVTVRGSWIYQNVVGGWLDRPKNHALPFLISALVCLTVMLMAFWRPRAIFRSGDEVFVSVIPEGAVAATKRLLRHKAIYLPAIVLFLWEFAPGWGTPLLRYLTQDVHLSEMAFANSQGYLRGATVLSALCYSFLCRYVRFKPMLNIGTTLGVIGAPAFLLIHNAGQANVVSFIAGLCCGIALASYYDLLVRCCPKELEGVAFMLTYGLFTFAGDISDVLGSYLYQHGGFQLALEISTAGNALIFIPIALLPRLISEPQEGDQIIDVDPPKLALETA